MSHPRFSIGAAAGILLAVAAPLLGQASKASTSRFVIDSATLHNLPVTDPREAAALLPGVFALVDARDLSIRGGHSGDIVVLVDGARLRNGQRGASELIPSMNGIADLTVTTGVAGVATGEAVSGVLSFATPLGGRRVVGSLRYRADDIGLDLWRNVGFNRVEATLGGPVRAGVTFFTALTLDGQRSLETEQLRDVQAPVYVASGVDTIVRQPATVGDPLSDTIDLAIPRFVQYSGYCERSSNSGAGCQGLQLPFTARGSYAWQAKVQRAYGAGSHVSVTGLANQTEAREFPWAALYNPGNRAATHASNRALILDWTHELTPVLALDLNVSYQADDRISGPLTQQSELDSRDPAGGFLLGGLDFVAGFDASHAVTIAGTTYPGVKYLEDRQIQCLQAGGAACQDLAPYLDRNDLLSSQPYRMNPYGVELDALFPLYTRGLDGTFDLSHERRWLARAGLDWQIRSSQRLQVGGEFERFDTRRYASGLISAFGVNAYVERPVRQGAWVEDRFELGALVLVGGLRWDRFDSRALYPRTPGRISSDTVAFDPADPTRYFVRAPAHTAWSPRFQAEYALSTHTQVRFSAGQQVQTPAFEWLFQRKNTDLAQSNRSMAIGRDLDFSRTQTLELGLRRELDSATVLDLAVYTKDIPSGVVIRLTRLPDPAFGGTPADFRLFANEDVGYVRGIDVRVEHRISPLLASWLAYTYQSGSALDESRQVVAGSAALTLPDGWRGGTRLGAILENTGVFATFRLGSNRRYTRESNQGLGLTIGEGVFPIGEVNGSALPTLRTVDVRVTRALKLGRFGGTFFAESRNLLNWSNLVDIFTETESVTNAAYRSRFLSDQAGQLMAEAGDNGLATTDPLSGDPAVDLSQPGVCAGWTSRNSPGSYAGGPADCVLLQGAERRFGNADGLFTQTEFTKAFGAWYDLANAPYRFYGSGRRIRVGMEFRF